MTALQMPRLLSEGGIKAKRRLFFQVADPPEQIINCLLKKKVKATAGNPAQVSFPPLFFFCLASSVFPSKCLVTLPLICLFFFFLHGHRPLVLVSFFFFFF